ncbi:MAG: FAD:protein FMN transferase [Treponema sp.]|jgi:thiamine biosynthesis lipoprotein|nr:FAD:protein FMN transferase [Treponema sp.]
MAIKKKPLLVILLLISLLPAGCDKGPSLQREFALGTICAVNLFGEGNEKVYSRIFARIREIDRTMTAFPGEFQELLGDGGPFTPYGDSAAMFQSAVDTLTSGVVAINEQAGIAPVRVRADLIALLEKALYYAELSNGAFDPTVGPLVRLWGIGTKEERVPSLEEIAAVLELINWRDVDINREEGTVFLRREGMALDLGAIAKGYAGDEAARVAREAGAKRGIFDLGGNIVTLGFRAQNRKGKFPWRIAIQNPTDRRGAYIGILSVNDTSVVTSGIYERFFESEGKRYHHIFSTADGYPAENGLMSVTIVTESSTDADALSTSVFAMGYARGRALIDSIPGAEAIFIFHDRSVRLTGNLAGIFELTNNEFAVID